ncbi:hemin transporter, partial [Nonomuraea sp. RK-328]|nr:hemin transporter [Nonomuraea sp. RK-328]
MLEALAGARSGRRVLVLHADTSASAHALRADMARLADELPAGERVFWYEDVANDAADGARAGRMDLTGAEIPEGAVAYLCGPLPFMRDVRAQLVAAGVAPRDVHYEVFGPDLWLARD